MKSRRLQRKQWKRFVRQQPKKYCVVYGLYDYKDNLRYIGQTRQLLSERLRWFYKQVTRARNRGKALTTVEKWVEHVKKYNGIITIKPIDENGTWNVSEIIHIDRANQSGADLLNMTRGGEDTIHAVSK